MKMKRTWLVLGSLLSLAACADATSTVPTTPVASSPAGVSPSAQPSVAPATVLQGKVLDDLGVAVAGAKVEAFADDVSLGATETAQDGTYRFASLKPGAIKALVSKDGFTARTRRATLVEGQTTTLDFGQVSTEGVERNFLSSKLEVTEVVATEEAPGRGLSISMRFSQPLTAEGQTDALSRLSLLNPDEKTLLRPSLGAREELATTTKWEDGGQKLTLKYAGPFLASAPNAARAYALQFRQERKDSRNSETQEYNYEDMAIRSASGAMLGGGRADYAFFSPPAEGLLPWTLLSDKKVGFDPQIAMWRLTHQRAFAIQAGVDRTPPAIASMDLRRSATVGGSRVSVLRVTFNEPLYVAKNEDEYRFTRLDFEKQLFRLKTSATTLADAKEVTVSPAVRVDPYDARVLNLDFPENTFEDKHWMELILTPDFVDPVGNAPDPKADRQSLEIK